MPKTTSSKPPLQEVATVEKDTDIFWGWTTRMENPDTVLRYESSGQGVKLYEELERDWQVAAMLQTRNLALQACEWQVEPATDKRADKKIAEFVEEVLKESNFDRLSGDLSHAILCGYKPVEIMWDASEGEVWVREFRGRRPSRFVFDQEGALRLLTPTSMFDGESVPDRKFCTWSFGGHDWNPYGRGLGYHCYWPVWFKKHGVKFWVVYCEKFGAPTPIGKYPPGTGEGDKTTLLNAIKAIQQQTGIRIPDTMAIEYLEASRTGQGTYQDLCDYMDRAIAKVFLGQTLTSDSGTQGSGSYALGKVHDEVRGDILKADADSMCESINRTVVRWLVDYNFPMDHRDLYPKVWRRTEPEEDLKPLAERDKILLVDMGLAKRVPETYIEETYNIPLAKEGEPTIGSVESVESSSLLGRRIVGSAGRTDQEASAQEFAESMDAEDRKAVAGQAELEKLLDAAIDRAEGAIDEMIGPVLQFIDGAESLAEIGEKLYDFYPRLGRERFQELLARAMFAAGLTGGKNAR